MPHPKTSPPLITVAAAAFVGLSAMVAGVGAAPATRPAAQPPREVARLIEKLSSPSAEARDAAAGRLTEVGAPAIPALKQARLGSDARVRQAAQAVLDALGMRAARARDALRPQGKLALEAKDYAGAALVYGQLVLAGDASADDWLGMARAMEGVQDWREALEAYRRALGLIDLRLAAEPQVQPEPVDGGQDRAGRTGPVQSPEVARERLEREKAELRPQRLQLLLDMGRLQRDRLDDPAGAALTFQGGLSDAPELTQRSIRDLADGHLKLLKDGTPDALSGPGEADLARQVEYQDLLHRRLELLKESAATHEAAGRIEEAVDALSRVALAQAITGGNAARPDVKPLARVLRKLPAGRPLPPTPMLHVLTPDRPTFTADIGTPEAQAAAGFWQFTIHGMRAYSFYVAAAPGRELATVELTCDMERTEALKMGYGVRLVELRQASIYSTEVPMGRKVLAKVFNVPEGEGGGPLHVQVMGTAREGFMIHRVEVKATFRDAKPADAKPADAKPADAKPADAKPAAAAEGRAPTTR